MFVTTLNGDKEHQL